MSGLVAFTPGKTVTLTANNTGPRIALPNIGGSVRIANIGIRETFVKFGDNTVVATLGGNVSIMGNSMESFTVPQDATHISAICLTSTILNITQGQGR